MIAFLYGVPIDLSGNRYVDLDKVAHKTWQKCYCTNKNLVQSDLEKEEISIYEARHFLLGVLAHFVYVKVSLITTNDGEQPEEVSSHAFNLLHIPPKHLFSNTFNWEAKINKFCKNAGIQRENAIGWYAIAERMGNVFNLNKGTPKEFTTAEEIDELDEEDEEMAAWVNQKTGIEEEPTLKKMADFPDHKRYAPGKPRNKYPEEKIWPLKKDIKRKAKEKKKGGWTPME